MSPETVSDSRRLEFILVGGKTPKGRRIAGPGHTVPRRLHPVRACVCVCVWVCVCDGGVQKTKAWPPKPRHCPHWPLASTCWNQMISCLHWAEDHGSYWHQAAAAWVPDAMAAVGLGAGWVISAVAAAWWETACGNSRAGSLRSWPLGPQHMSSAPRQPPAMPAPSLSPSNCQLRVQGTQPGVWGVFSRAYLFAYLNACCRLGCVLSCLPGQGGGRGTVAVPGFESVCRTIRRK